MQSAVLARTHDTEMSDLEHELLLAETDNREEAIDQAKDAIWVLIEDSVQDAYDLSDKYPALAAQYSYETETIPNFSKAMDLVDIGGYEGLVDLVEVKIFIEPEMADDFKARVEASNEVKIPVDAEINFYVHAFSNDKAEMVMEVNGMDYQVPLNCVEETAYADITEQYLQAAFSKTIKEQIAIQNEQFLDENHSKKTEPEYNER